MTPLQRMLKVTILKPMTPLQRTAKVTVAYDPATANGEGYDTVVPFGSPWIGKSQLTTELPNLPPYPLESVIVPVT